MNYYNYQVKNAVELTEVLIALFNELSFEAFEELEDGFDAFIAEPDATESVELALKDLQERFPFTWEKVFVPYQNWNEEWEKNFDPVVVGDFCAIRADFHPAFPNVAHEIVINPKMAFGTGHHETTHMMMETMENMDFVGKKVLDYGCGTGILAVLAIKLGATHVEAIDIEEESYLNTLENKDRNNTPSIIALHGTLPDVIGNEYDIILANINRNVILESLPSLYQKVKTGGFLVVSGFLEQDENLLVEATAKNGFNLINTRRRGKWISQLLDKK